jgi:hypothetical protein
MFNANVLVCFLFGVIKSFNLMPERGFSIEQVLEQEDFGDHALCAGRAAAGRI